MPEITVLCKSCSTPFIQNSSRKTQIFCTRSCGVMWRTKHVYKHKFSVVHRGKSPRNFLKALAVKKSERRNLSIDFLESLYNSQKGLCAVSGVQMTYLCGQGKVDTNISLDRINSDLGYEEGNIQLVCKRVNILKFDRDLTDLLMWCKTILAHNKANNV